MAKKQTMYNPYADREEQIRKAKGNPNKNIHHKKKNSNYGGVAPAPKEPQREGPKTPKWMRISLGALVVVLIAIFILRLTVWKDSALMSYISSIVLGVSCGALVFIRRYTKTGREGTLYSILSVVLVMMCVFYVAIGLMGLFGKLG